MKSKFIGGILLIVGTSIGGGMLALPLANAATGFWPSTGFLLLCWAVMTFGALFILEATLYLPRGKHMLSMAAATLGKTGLLVTWLSYLFLFYTLLAAYIAGGADIFSHLFALAGIKLSGWQTSILFTGFFGIIVAGGIHQVDRLNRGLMFGKLAIYLMLVMLIAPQIKSHYLTGGDYRQIHGSALILITSFGFAIIVPNLRDYFNDNIKQLKQVILIGSVIPLLCYLAWDAVIMGSLPSTGEHGLVALMNKEHPNSALATQLSLILQNNLISALFNFFTSICMLTAFLGVALCLMSFLADGLKMAQHGKEGLYLFLLTFLPPLLIVIYYPGAYLHALNYAGIFCVILLLLLPALMTLNGRKKFSAPYQVPGGQFSQWLVIAVGILLLMNAVS